MTYQSPIHLISDKNLTEASPNNLDKWEQELLAKINQSPSKFITVNSLVYYKTGVENIFGELRNNFDFHFNLYKNTSLLAFIEKDDLQFFLDSKAQDAFINNEQKGKIYPLFTEKYGKIVSTAIESPNKENLDNLRILTSSKIEISPDFVSDTFAHGLSRFSAFVENFRQISYSCYQTDFHKEFTPQIQEFINPEIRTLLSILPKSFDGLKKDFASVIRRNILKPSFGTNSEKVLKAHQKTKETLLVAARIDKDIQNKADIDGIISKLEQVTSSVFFGVKLVKRKRVSYKEPVNPVIATALIMFALIAAIFIWFGVNSQKASESNRFTSSRSAYTPSGGSSRTSSRAKNRKKAKPTEAYKETESVDVDRLKFSPQDLLGNWGVSRQLEDDSDIEILYTYTFSNYVGGKRKITYSDPRLKSYSVIQNFTYSVLAENYYSGKLYLKFKETEYQSCTTAEGQKLLRLAEEMQEMEVNYLSKDMSIDFSIPGNKSLGIVLGQESYELALGDGDVTNYKEGKIRTKYIVRYVNKLMETRGVTVDQTNNHLRFYADKSGKFIMAKTSKHSDKIAEIKISPSGKIYFKAISKILPKKDTAPCFEVKKVSFLNKSNKYFHGKMTIEYNRKEGFSANIK